MSGCDVTEPLRVTYGVGGKLGYGFHIVNNRGAPLATFTFATEEAADQARELVLQVNGVDVLVEQYDVAVLVGRDDDPGHCSSPFGLGVLLLETIQLHL